MAYTINEKDKTVTRVVDADTGQTETASIDELLELLFYLKGREDDLRFTVFHSLPLTIARPWSLINGYMVAITKERRAVKVKADVYQKFLVDQEQVLRENWLARKQEERALRERGPYMHIDQIDARGNVIPPVPEIEWTTADAPLNVINEYLLRFQSPDYWANRPENLDSQKTVKLP